MIVTLPSIPVEESLAIARISERVSRLRPLKFDDSQYMAAAAGIAAVVPQGIIPSFERLLGTSHQRPSLSKAEVLQFLLSAYRGSPDRFPHLLELVLQHALTPLARLHGPGKLRWSPVVAEAKSAELELNRRYFVACASVLRLGFKFETDGGALDPLKVRVFKEETGATRRAEKDRLHHVLESSFPEEFNKLQGAYERYTSGGPDAYRGAVDSCRSAYEFFFRKLTGATQEDKWHSKLGEVFPQSTLRNFIKETYSYLSSAGTHSPHDRERVEALLAIRATEDVMVCALNWSGKWAV